MRAVTKNSEYLHGNEPIATIPQQGK
jgi:hypothetical protein